MVLPYHCLPFRGTQDLTSGLGIEESKRPDHDRSCVGSHALTKLIGLEPRMVEARDACSGVERLSVVRGTGKSSQCERVQMRESSSNICWGIILCFYILCFTSYTSIGNKNFLSTTLVTLVMKD